MDKTKRMKKADRTVVYIDRNLVRIAKELAARCDSTLSEVMESLLRPRLVRRHEKVFGK